MQGLLNRLGLKTSKGDGAAQQKSPAKVILVPPLFGRDLYDLSRFASSTAAYELVLARPQLRRLFSEHVPDGLYRGTAFLSPSGEERLSLHAALAPGNGSMTLRFQPHGPKRYDTFAEVEVAPQGADKASLRASVFHPDLGLGAFINAPLAKKVSGTKAQVGLRYSSPFFTAGLVSEPASSKLSHLWLVGRYQGLVAALQMRPDLLTSTTTATGSGAPPGSAGSDGLFERVKCASSVALAWAPVFGPDTARPGYFVACVEWQEGRNLVLSYLQHAAQVRPVVNPTESRNVVGITNYIDVGAQIHIPTTPDDAPSKSSGAAAAAPQDVFNVAGSWQVNKNWLVKARVGDASASACVALRSWSQTSFILALSATCRYEDLQHPRVGVAVQLENFGERRYERGASALAGRAVLQRHEANVVDLANAEGDTGDVVVRDAGLSSYNAGAEPDRVSSFL